MRRHADTREQRLSITQRPLTPGGGRSNAHSPAIRSGGAEVKGSGCKCDFIVLLDPPSVSPSPRLGTLHVSPGQRGVSEETKTRQQKAFSGRSGPTGRSGPSVCTCSGGKYGVTGCVEEPGKCQSE